MKQQDAAQWSKSRETEDYRKILQRRIDETWEDLVGKIPELATVEEIGVASLKAVMRIEGFLIAIDESRASNE